LPSETIGSVARRYVRAGHSGALRYRADAALPLDAAAASDRPLLFDTTVYLDRGAGRLPPIINALIEAEQHQVHHCGVVCAELAISIGILDPSDPRTPRTIAVILAHLHQMGGARDVSPTASAWTEAAILAGMLARTQGLAVPRRQLNPDQLCCQIGRRRELLLDALLYVTAIERDMLLLSGNIRHMDLLLQLRPSHNVLLYRPL
jgi:hypothetical protein